MDLFVKYLKKYIYDNYAKGSRFIPADQLKPKVLKNALNTFARGCSQEKVIALCDLARFRHGTAGFLLTEDKMFYRELYSPEECDEIIDIRNIEKYIAVTGFWFEHNLPVNLDELEEEEENITEDYTAFILQYENGDQILLQFKECYVDIRNTLDAIDIAKRMAKAEREKANDVLEEKGSEVLQEADLPISSTTEEKVYPERFNDKERIVSDAENSAFSGKEEL